MLRSSRDELPRSEKTYFDVRIFNPHAPSNKNMAPSACYKKHERETPLVLAATGGLGVEATTFYKRLASKLSQKWDSPYSTTRVGYDAAWPFPSCVVQLGHQRCQILLWACRKIPRSNGSDHRGIEDHGCNLDNHHPSLSFSLP